MLLGDLVVGQAACLPIEVVVFNKRALGFIELEQKSPRFIDTRTGLDNPDFATTANAIGIHGVRIDDPADVQAKMAEALAYPGLC